MSKSNNENDSDEESLYETMPQKVYKMNQKKRIVRKGGMTNVSYKNISKKRRRYISDLYTTLLDSSWTYVVLLFASSFYGSWIMFGGKCPFLIRFKNIYFKNCLGIHSDHSLQLFTMWSATPMVTSQMSTWPSLTGCPASLKPMDLLQYFYFHWKLSIPLVMAPDKQQQIVLTPSWSCHYRYE